MFTLSDDPTSKDYITAHRLTLLILIKNYADIYNGKNDDYPRLIWQDGTVLHLRPTPSFPLHFCYL